MSRSPTLFTRRSSVTTEDSLRSCIFSLAQSIKPAVSPTTPRVKHVRRLSEDFAHPPPPPTPPPPPPSLPKESESEDVAESVISDWGDHDEIHEEAEAPPADATRADATPKPAAFHHADTVTHPNPSQHRPRLWSRSRSLTLRTPERRFCAHRPSLLQGHSMQMLAPLRNLPQFLLPITKAWCRWR